MGGVNTIGAVGFPPRSLLDYYYYSLGIVPKPLVVRPHVDNARQNSARMETRGGNVESQFSYRYPHSIHSEVTQTQDPGAIRYHDSVHLRSSPLKKFCVPRKREGRGAKGARRLRRENHPLQKKESRARIFQPSGEFSIEKNVCGF